MIARGVQHRLTAIAGSGIPEMISTTCLWTGSQARYPIQSHLRIFVEVLVLVANRLHLFEAYGGIW